MSRRPCPSRRNAEEFRDAHHTAIGRTRGCDGTDPARLHRAQRGRRRCIGARLDAARRGRGAIRRGRHRAEHLGRRAARRRLRGPHRAFRDGPGHADRSGPAGGRGARVRLVEGAHRADLAAAQPRRPARLGRDGHRRQPRHPHLARLRAPWWRRRTPVAAAGRGRRVEGAAGRAAHALRRGEARRLRPQCALRPVGRRRRPVTGTRPEGDHAEEPAQLDRCRPAAEAAGHWRQARRQQALCDRRAPAGHVERGHQGLPGVRRQAGRLRRGQGRHATRCARRGAGQRSHRGGGRRHLVAREDRARCAADPVGRGRGRCAQQRHHRRAPAWRARRRQRVRTARRRRRAPGDRRRGTQGRGCLRHAVPRPRNDGADELHGAHHGRSWRGVGADAERRSLVRRVVGRVGSAADQVCGAPARPGRRLRPPRRQPGLRAPGGIDRQAVPRCGGAIDLESRRGPVAGLLPPDLDVQTERRARRQRRADRAARARVGPVDQCLRGAADGDRRQGPAAAAGLLGRAR